MQSEIKFRGKRADTGEWVYGNLLKLESGFFTDNKDKAYEWYIIPAITNGSWNKNNLMLKFISPCFEVIPETVGQYTGLKDKNDEEIYGGDIAKVMDMTLAVVRYSENRGAYYLECENKIGDVGLICQYDTIEVIGNIYDNPELLQEVE